LVDTITVFGMAVCCISVAPGALVLPAEDYGWNRFLGSWFYIASV